MIELTALEKTFEQPGGERVHRASRRRPHDAGRSVSHGDRQQRLGKIDDPERHRRDVPARRRHDPHREHGRHALAGAQARRAVGPSLSGSVQGHVPVDDGGRESSDGRAARKATRSAFGPQPRVAASGIASSSRR